MEKEGIKLEELDHFVSESGCVPQRQLEYLILPTMSHLRAYYIT